MRICPVRDPAVEAAIARQCLLSDNEFKIRALKRAAVEEGYGDDVMVSVLDLDDPYAKSIYDQVTGAFGPRYRRLGQPMQASDRVQMVVLPWPPFRDLFSPNHRATFDAARPIDIRVAVMSGGHTLAAIVPGDFPLKEVGRIATVEDEDGGTTAIVIPPGTLSDDH
jgi:hypothetical protein